MAITYEPIATTTLLSANATISFTSIPATYTDLRVVVVGKCTNGNNAWLGFNNETVSNYSYTHLYGDGTNAQSYNSSNQPRIALSAGGISTTRPEFIEIDIFAYTSPIQKTAIIRASQDANGSGIVSAICGLWRNLSAINSVQVYHSGDTWETGTIATLFGITAA